MKSKGHRLFVVLLVIVIALVSIPELEPMLQIYDRGYPVVRVKRDQQPHRHIPNQIYDGHLGGVINW